jgi:hypothetical protein
MKELIVETFNRETLDKTLQSLGGLVCEEPCSKNQYQVRSISGDIGFIKFAIQNQGYAKIVREQEIKEISNDKT